MSGVHRVLLCDSTPTSCAFSPGRSHVVIVGTSDGHVLLWDLREPTTRHTHPEMAKFGIENGFRSPTYMTEAGTPSAEAHASPIVRVVAIGKRGTDSDSQADGGGAPSDNAKKGLNALGKGQKSDTNGTFQVWGRGGNKLLEPVDLVGDRWWGLVVIQVVSFPSHDQCSMHNCSLILLCHVGHQVASIDDRGLVNIWTAVELDASRRCVTRPYRKMQHCISHLHACDWARANCSFLSWTATPLCTPTVPATQISDLPWEVASSWFGQVFSMLQPPVPPPAKRPSYRFRRPPRPWHAFAGRQM